MNYMYSLSILFSALALVSLFGALTYKRRSASPQVSIIRILFVVTVLLAQAAIGTGLLALWFHLGYMNGLTEIPQ